MMPHMAVDKPVLRFSECWLGRLAGWLLAALWIYSMAGVNSYSFSAYPVCVVLVVVLGVAGAGLLAGYRFVSPGWVSWFTLAAAGYFLARCLNSYALVDSWEDEAIILGSVVFYVAGVYVAQNASHGKLFWILALALVLNVVAFWLVRGASFRVEWFGRAQYTPEGEKSLPMSLFLYKNFAGFFFVTGGIALTAWGCWALKGIKLAVVLLVAIGSVAVSFMCHTRVPFFMLPIGLAVIWGLDVMQQLYKGAKMGVMGWCGGFIMLVLLGICVYDVLFGNVVSSSLHNAESHLRYEIWAAACEVLPTAPMWGCGAGAAEWELIPFFNEWNLPNYVHNDYLQVWLDYGVIGIVLVVIMVALHVVQAFRCLASDLLSKERRVLVSVSFVLVVLVAVYAVSDFPMHSFAIVTMGAFACGVLASPFSYVRSGWVASQADGKISGSAVVKVKALALPGKIVQFVCVCMLLCSAVHLGENLRPAWMMQWKYNEYAQAGKDPDGSIRRSMIAELMPRYPAPALMDNYYRLPVGKVSLAEQEKLLKMALNANPKQLFTALNLAEVLDIQLKFEESESLMRRMYHGSQMRASMLALWPAHYAYHLLQWGRYELRMGQRARALSLLEHALKMDKVRRIDFFLAYRGGDPAWLKEHRKQHRRPVEIQHVYTDVRLLRKIGIQPDDSWKAPMAPGEQPAMYSSLIEKIAL